jgi:hypothetical protein
MEEKKYFNCYACDLNKICSIRKATNELLELIIKKEISEQFPINYIPEFIASICKYYSNNNKKKEDNEIVNAEFTSEWSDGIIIKTPCKYNKKLGHPFEVTSYDYNSKGCLVEQYITYYDLEAKEYIVKNICQECNEYIIENGKCFGNCSAILD